MLRSIRVNVVRWVVMALATIVWSCGAAPSEGETIAQRIDALETSALTPWPCNDTGITWNGTTTELLVADAMAGCGSLTYPSHLDAYLANVYAKMQSAYSITHPYVLDAWRSLRAGKEYIYQPLPAGKNCDPRTAKPVERSVVISRTPVGAYLGSSVSGYDNANNAAQIDIDQATINLCIAQRLRNLAPGASAGEALLLPDSEQRELMETIRERAQISMLQYALLGVVFTNDQSPTWSGEPSVRLPPIFGWANSIFSHAYELKALGHDFSAAVQLHSVVSSELFDLYARSRSARTPLPYPATSRAAELWGKGSWYQRMLAVAYGGDPLFETKPGLTGDIHTRTDAMVGYPSGLDFANQRDWPDQYKAPYLKTPIDRPQISALLELARRYDRLDLVVKGTLDNSCDPIDIERTAARIYRLVEAEVRRSDCIREQAGVPKPGACSATLEMPTTPPGSVLYRLQEKYRIDIDHARALAAHLAEAAGLFAIGVGGIGGTINDTCAARVFTFQSGALDLVGSLTDAGVDGGETIYHLSRDAKFVSPGLNEVAGIYSQRASLRFPTPAEIRDLGATRPASLFGFGPVYNEVDFKAIEAKRTMGAISAQAAVHKMVQDSIQYLRSGQGAGVRLSDYFQFADAILEVTGAQAGRVVSFRPSYDATGQIEAGALGGGVSGPGFKHIVEIEMPIADTFWQPASGFVIELYSLPGPDARILGAQPETNWFGAKWATLAPTLGNPVQGVFRSIPGVSDRRLWFTKVTLAAGTNTHSFVVGRRSLTGAVPTAYRLIAANVRIAPDRGRDGQTFGFGGALGGRMERQITGRSGNPTVPAYDGFDLPTDWVPPYSAELLGGSASESSVDRYLTLADEAAKEATTAVEAALDSVVGQINAEAGETRQLAENQAKRAYAAGQAQAAIAEDQSRLCGVAGPGCTEKLAAISGVTFFQAPPVNPNARVLGAPTTCTVNNTPAGYKCRIDRLVNQEYNRLDALVRSLSIPLPVARAFTPPVKLDGQLQPPSGTSTFDEFSGGALQGAMLDLLHALEAPRPILATLKTAAQRAYDGMDRAVAVVDQAIAQTNAAVAQENYLTQSEALKCDPQDLMDAMYFSRPIELVPVVPGAHAPAAKCISDPANYTSDYCVADDSGFDLVVTDDCCYAKVHNDPGHGTIAYKEDNDQLLNAGAWKALITECQVLRDQIKKGGAADTQTIATAAQKKVADIGVLVEQADALNAVQTLSIQLDEARAAIRTKYVALQKLMNDSRAAVARAETERKLNDDLAAATPFGQYSNGTYRLYRNHELWRAKATVDHARRYALAARRAIEARYVVDLSSLSEDEAFVASPRTWADEIYSYDLSLPAALGLSTSVGQSGTAYSSKVKDYVNNLKAFVAGYAARRPLAVATNEVDVITLPGLAPESAAFVNLAPAAATAGGASQSATLGGAVASRAADGNTSGVLANNSVSQTGQVPGVASWWNLDLQDYKWIDNITLWNRLDIVDSTQTLPLLVLVSDEPITAQFYFQALSSPGATWYLANLDGSFALPIKVSVGRWGRYVRVLPAVSFFSNLSLAEVQVWGYAPDNVALGRATTQSSTLRAASEAVDGFKGPIETGVPPQGPVSYASTNADVGTWWQVDLGTQRQIDRIELYHARALNVDSPAGVLHVLIADEPIVERGLQAIVARSDVSDTVIDVNAVSQTPAHVLPGRKGRYVRIWSTSGRILLGEVEVLSRPVQYPGWMLHCTDAGDGKPGWVPLSQRCEKAGAVSRADRAKLEFALDPWGRLEGSISQEPFRRRHNVRWGPLAVNIVGTGVRDCAKATDSKGCFAQGFIPFGLSHVGTPWITDYNGIWRSANMPEGRIEGGKALAAELWLDPLKDGWATSYIAPVARSEWEHRPLGGAYEISLDISPDVVIDRIDRVQLLVGSSSWVKQQ